MNLEVVEKHIDEIKNLITKIKQSPFEASIKSDIKKICQKKFENTKLNVDLLPKSRVDELKKYSEYLDSESKGKIKDEKINPAIIFELVIAEFLEKNGFLLQKHEESNGNEKTKKPDILFKKREKSGTTYILECLTINKTGLGRSKNREPQGLFSKWIEMFPKFKKYTEILFFLKEVYVGMEDKSNVCWLSTHSIEPVWNYVPYQEKIRILGQHPNERIFLAELKEFVECNQFVFYNKETQRYLPDDILKLLKAFDLFPVSTQVNHIVLESTLISKAIIDKLKVKNFKKEPVILAVSSATMYDLHACQDLSQLVKWIKIFLSEVKGEFKNLYAIIINPFLFSWSLEIAKELPGLMIEDRKNYFGVIYNNDLIKKYGRIFESIIDAQYSEFF